MELKVLEEKKNKMILELKGADNTLCNAVKAELWNDSHVKAAGFNLSHPQTGIPKIVVETDGNELPKKALQEAVKRLKKELEKFKTEVKKEIK